MKLRLRAEIERARLAEGTTELMRKRLEDGLAQLELAHIGTIHAFCGDVLHERPVEAGVDLLFKIAADDEAEALLDEARDHLRVRRCDAASYPPGRDRPAPGQVRRRAAPWVSTAATSSSSTA